MLNHGMDFYGAGDEYAYHMIPPTPINRASKRKTKASGSAKSPKRKARKSPYKTRDKGQPSSKHSSLADTSLESKENVDNAKVVEDNLVSQVPKNTEDANPFVTPLKEINQETYSKKFTDLGLNKQTKSLIEVMFEEINKLSPSPSDQKLELCSAKKRKSTEACNVSVMEDSEGYICVSLKVDQNESVALSLYVEGETKKLFPLSCEKKPRTEPAKEIVSRSPAEQNEVATFLDVNHASGEVGVTLSTMLNGIPYFQTSQRSNSQSEDSASTTTGKGPDTCHVSVSLTPNGEGWIRVDLCDEEKEKHASSSTPETCKRKVLCSVRSPGSENMASAKILKLPESRVTEHVDVQFRVCQYSVALSLKVLGLDLESAVGIPAETGSQEKSSQSGTGVGIHESERCEEVDVLLEEKVESASRVGVECEVPRKVSSGSKRSRKFGALRNVLFLVSVVAAAAGGAAFLRQKQERRGRVAPKSSMISLSAAQRTEISPEAGEDDLADSEPSTEE